MNGTLSDIIANLRALNWDEMITYLCDTFIPNILNEVFNNANVKDKEEIHLLNNCVDLIQTAIENKDVILLCDLLEYEFAVIVESILREEGEVNESGDL